MSPIDCGGYAGWEDDVRKARALEAKENEMPDNKEFNEMKEKIFERAAEILSEKNYRATYEPRYSGRGMFGSTTPALITDAPIVLTALAIVKANSEFGKEVEVERILESAEKYMPWRRDQMGRDSIVFY